jgi:GDP-L-fucose synthase
MPIAVHRGAERSWCHVRDLVRGVRLVLEADTHHTTFNVGRDDQPVSMLELAERACDMTGAPRSLIAEIDPPVMQTVVKRLDTSRLFGLGWKPEIELDEGLPELLEWVSRFDRTGELRAPLAA